jgi:hypothetical protein
MDINAKYMDDHINLLRENNNNLEEGFKRSASKFSCTINTSEESELRVYLKANDYLSALRELEGQLRNFYKYGFPLSITTGDAVDKIRDMFCKILEDYGIDLREGN